MEVLLEIILLCAIVSLASASKQKCDFLKKVSYGETLVVTSFTDDEPVNCRWKFRVPKGLNVRFEFTDFDLDPAYSNFTVYDSRKPFSWQSDRIITLLNGQRNETMSSMFWRLSEVAVKYQHYLGKSRFSLNFDARIPIDDNCGFFTKPTEKVQSIRSPGFPNSEYPTNLRCRWTIRAGRGQLVSLNLKKLKTEADEDHLEIHLDNRTERLFGALRRRRNYVSRSGEIVLYFHTNGENGNKGFKATYTSVGAGRITGSGKRITCVSKAVETRQAGKTISHEDDVSCPPFNQCGRTYVKGSTSSNEEVITETMGCLPTTSCNVTSCKSVPSSSGFALYPTSCWTTCCDSNLCNDQVVNTESTESIQCYESLIAKGPGTEPITTFADKSNEKTCGIEAVCTKTKATILVGPEKAEVTVLHGTCLPVSACENSYCKVLETSGSLPKGTIFSNCSVSCCNTNLCNSESSIMNT